MKVLEHKSVLFFCYPYRKYNKQIITALKDMGADVTYFSDSPKSRFFKILPKSIKVRIINYYYKYILYKIRGKKFDFVFVIKGTFLSVPFLKKIKTLNQDSLFLLYLWDTFKNYNYKDKLDCFDKTFSFDSIDCENFDKLEYLPLFYIKEYQERKKKEKNIDLFFIGSGVNYRKQILERLIFNLKKEDLKCKFYFPSLNLFIKTIFKKDKYFIYPAKELKHSKFIDELLSSRAVVDIQAINQAGLTMRTIEVLGSGQKLITTNENIIKEPFYNVNNICLINREKPVFPLEFLDSEYIYVDMSAYTLESFLKRIFL
ncbi:MAG: hypothetical protein A2W91_07210 [Bacteroidetes bacterium GWF2_38_335]|nr:MAG: hypothetical protein A2W91_07210 [Bacteroidetes bacterium GWF2_38_335]OFY77116.1 MAG: hypothetical protein A2281_14445 [Bacteroidetes bacterium RIFOXYA12_FULL_38_20]HBS85007.1 hypothetical protein [Bacteroidales bacterium]